MIAVLLEEKALLLARLGRHEQVIGIYVTSLNNHEAAERWVMMMMTVNIMMMMTVNIMMMMTVNMMMMMTMFIQLLWLFSGQMVLILRPPCQTVVMIMIVYSLILQD